jgi:hypothetical protein
MLMILIVRLVVNNIQTGVPNCDGGDKCSLSYDPGIMGVMPWAVGCLTRKNTHQCRVVLVPGCFSAGLF